MIPGLKLIDDLLKGLPENARLREQLSELRPQIATLGGQLQDALAEVERLKHKYESSAKLMPEELAILRFMGTAHDYVYADGIARDLGLEVTRVEWLLGRLVKSQHIYQTPNVPPRFHIEQKGRDSVHNPD